MNRAWLIKQMGTLGYKAEAPTLESIQKFLTDENVTLQDGDGAAIDVAKAWSVEAAAPVAKPARTVQVETEDLTAIKAQAKAFRDIEAAKAARGMAGAEQIKVGSPVRHGSESVRKAYNARPSAIGMANATPYNSRAFNDADEAIAFGVWAKSVLAPRFMTDEDNALIRKANITTTQTSGGALVPDDFSATLIDLKEERGVGRRAVPPEAMARDTMTYPRRTGGLTVYYPGEATAITESNPAVNNVKLTATKMATLTHVSNELLNDAAISFGDLVAREIAYTFADKEDEDLFNGNGTSTYGGRTGLRAALTNLSGTIANIAGLFVGSGNAYSELTVPDFNGTAGLLPAYVKNPKWYMHKRFFETVCGGLAVRPGASGGAAGATMTEMAGYRLSGNPTWLGYPVEFVQVMPRAEGNSQVCVLFGELGLAAKQGTVKGIEIASSEHYGFNSDVLTIRGIQRHAITVHDPGNASATESLRTPGPYVGLITASS